MKNQIKYALKGWKNLISEKPEIKEIPFSTGTKLVYGIVRSRIEFFNRETNSKTYFIAMPESWFCETLEITPEEFEKARNELEKCELTFFKICQTGNFKCSLNKSPKNNKINDSVKVSANIITRVLNSGGLSNDESMVFLFLLMNNQFEPKHRMVSYEPKAFREAKNMDEKTWIDSVISLQEKGLIEAKISETSESYIVLQ